MSQKSILSFFSKQNAKTSPAGEKSSSAAVKTEPEKDAENNNHLEEENAKLEANQRNNVPGGEDSASNSPVKMSKGSKRKRVMSSSESEDETASKAKSSPKAKKSSPEVAKSSEKKPTPTKSPKKEPVEKAKPTSKKGKEKSTPKTARDSKPATENGSKNASPLSPGGKISPKKEKESPSKSESTSKPAKVATHSFFTVVKKESDGTSSSAAGDESKGDGTSYDPGKKNYHPIKDAFWKKGDRVPYLALARTFQVIEETSGRLRMIEILSNYFRSVILLSPSDLLASVYLCLNQLAPAYEGVELGIAEFSLMKAIAQSTGRSLAQIKADAQSTGDLGLVAEQSKSSQRMMFRPAPLTVETVFTKLREIARMTGTASIAKKMDKIQSMFVACRHSESRFVIRSLAGKLRIGLAEQSLLQALAQACAYTPPHLNPPVVNALSGEGDTRSKARVDEIALTLKTVYCQCPNYNQIVPVLLEHGIDELVERCPMRPGTPLKPMLAHPTKGVQEVLQRFDGIDFTCEWKYDGERAQIHLLPDGSVQIFSRNQENNTSKYPDIIARLELTRTDKVESAILDCEAVAWDPEKQQILPFQVLSTRKRKDANEADIKVQVCVFMFDLLYLNGKPLVEKPFQTRREQLYEHFRPVEGQWKYATCLDTNDLDELQRFLEEAVRGNCEGLMVKTLQRDATYEIAKRSRNWLKLKKDYLSGVGDSLDLVVIGGYRGRGKRTGTYGGFLLACYDDENEEYQTICKIGTGFSDEDLQRHTEFLNGHVIPKPKPYYRYEPNLAPDEWFEAVQVWEVLCADLSLSPVHQAAIGIIDPEKGISLRFPRFIRIRDDKGATDATNARQVSEMYLNQDQIKNQAQGGGGRDAEEDFY
ncbi:DNA ligase 1 [Anopheles ziemanni]|uniref:DNA ligase 1 n=1 Tax=Anopheles coustani TaxID=139045 RepID=UPI00265B4605|nr:DNA ligase 1 [Anopheles coustani]XP_058169786.1 DNA ligase 1 [Anopheles ziemanni]